MWMAVVPGSRSNLAAKELSEVLLRHCRTSLERCLETGVLREAKQLIWDSESAYRLAQWKGDSVLLLEVRIFEERLDDVIKCKCDEAFSKVHPQEQELNCLSKAAVKNFKKDVKRAFKKKSQLSRERLTSMLDDVMAEFSQKASPYLCSLRTNVGMCLSWELRTSAAKLLLAGDHIIISCDLPLEYHGRRVSWASTRMTNEWEWALLPTPIQRSFAHRQPPTLAQARTDGVRASPRPPPPPSHGLLLCWLRWETLFDRSDRLFISN